MHVCMCVCYLCTETVRSVFFLFVEPHCMLLLVQLVLKGLFSLPTTYCAFSSFVKTLPSLAKRQCVLKSPLNKTSTHRQEVKDGVGMC